MPMQTALDSQRSKSTTTFMCSIVPCACRREYSGNPHQPSPGDSGLVRSRPGGRAGGHTALRIHRGLPSLGAGALLAGAAVVGVARRKRLAREAGTVTVD